MMTMKHYLFMLKKLSIKEKTKLCSAEVNNAGHKTDYCLLAENASTLFYLFYLPNVE